jgi:hypothetical protein
VLVAVEDILVTLLVPASLLRRSLLRRLLLLHRLRLETSRFLFRLLLFQLPSGDILEMLAHLGHVEAVDAEHGAPVFREVVAVTATILALLQATAAQGDEAAARLRTFRGSDFDHAVEEFAHRGVLFAGDKHRREDFVVAVVVVVTVVVVIVVAEIGGVVTAVVVHFVRGVDVVVVLVAGVVFASAIELLAFLATRALGSGAIAERAVFVLDVAAHRIAHIAHVFAVKLAVKGYASGIPVVVLALTIGRLRVADELPGAAGGGGKILGVKHVSILVSKVFRSTDNSTWSTLVQIRRLLLGVGNPLGKDSRPHTHNRSVEVGWLIEPFDAA